MIHYNRNKLVLDLKGYKAKGEDIQVTWDNPEQMESYIKKLQTAADRLTTENRKLRKVHFVISQKVTLTAFNYFKNNSVRIGDL